MNPWLVNMVSEANERLLTEREVERIVAYLDDLPAYVKLGEDLEKAELELITALPRELAELYPQRLGYTREVIRDLVESLRHLFVSVLTEEPDFLCGRWTSPLANGLRAAALEPEWAGDVYAAIDRRLQKTLRGRSLELYRPAMERLMEPLAGGTAR